MKSNLKKEIKLSLFCMGMSSILFSQSYVQAGVWNLGEGLTRFSWTAPSLREIFHAEEDLQVLKGRLFTDGLSNADFYSKMNLSDDSLSSSALGESREEFLNRWEERTSEIHRKRYWLFSEKQAYFIKHPVKPARSGAGYKGSAH